MKRIIQITDFEDWESKFMPCAYSNALLEKLYSINTTAKNKIDLYLIKKAIYAGSIAHAGQIRLSGEPYISHPIAAASMLAEYCNKTNVIVATILHDTLEDTHLTYDMIYKLFNQIVADHVLDVTRITWPDGTKMSASDTVTKLKSANKLDSLTIKLFDRVHNIQTLDYMPPEKIKSIIHETLLTFVALSEVLGLPHLATLLYNKCYQINLNLGIITPQEDLFSIKSQIKN